ncbi:MAG: GNVR domain-containing protein, partial [Bacteroidota bacterium]
MESPQAHTNKTNQADSIQIDLRKWLFYFLSYWWLFVLSLGIALPFGYAYLRYTTYQYSARALLLIKDAGKSGLLSEESILLTESLTGGRKAMDNEIQILQSLPLMEKVIDTLKANITYHRIGQIKEKELYHASPIKLDTFALATNRNSASLYIQPNDRTTFRLKTNKEEEGEIFRYGVPFRCKLGYFNISYVPGKSFSEDLHRVSVLPIVSVARRYQNKFKVERIGDQRASSVLNLKLNDPVPNKAEDIINMIIHIYNEAEIEDENKVLRNTIKFIDERVKKLTSELDLVESDIERYKRDNTIFTDDAVSSMNFNLGEIRAATKELSNFEIQKSLLSSLEEFLLANRETFEYIPSNLIVDHQELANQVNQYNGLLIELDRLTKIAAPQNPSRLALEKRLSDMRILIIESLQKVKRDLDIPMQKLQEEIEELQSNLSTVPGMEKNLLEKKRTQTIKENLFLLLLQKREETALSAAVTTASTRVIDHARSSSFPVTPQRQLILMASFLLGLLVPILLVILKKMMETTVQSEETVKNLTRIPILGRIVHHKKNEKIVVKSGDRSAINEMFRLLRTNLNFLNPGSDKQVLLITSSVSGEGKSFIAVN